MLEAAWFPRNLASNIWFLDIVFHFVMVSDPNSVPEPEPIPEP